MDKTMLRQVASAFVASRMLVITAALVSTMLITPAKGERLWSLDVPFFNLFARWDSGYYLDIAKEGYARRPFWAFRPLFPLLLGALATCSAGLLDFRVSAAISGFLANNLFLLAGLVLMYKLTCTTQSKELAQSAVVLLAFSPAAVFYSSIYTESLYLLLSAACYYALEKEMMLLSCSLGFLAGLTRPEGVLTSAVIGLKSWGRKQSKLNWLAPTAVAAVSLPVFLAYAQLTTGSYNVVFTSEVGWAKITAAQVFTDSYRMREVGLYLLISLPVMLVGLAALLSYFLRSKPKRGVLPYYLVSTILAVVYMVVGDVRSIPRLYSTAIPVYWTLSTWSAKGTLPRAMLLAFSIGYLTVGTGLFVNWYHFI